MCSQSVPPMEHHLPKSAENQCSVGEPVGTFLIQTTTGLVWWLHLGSQCRGGWNQPISRASLAELMSSRSVRDPSSNKQGECAWVTAPEVLSSGPHTHRDMHICTHPRTHMHTRTHSSLKDFNKLKKNLSKVVNKGGHGDCNQRRRGKE